MMQTLAGYPQVPDTLYVVINTFILVLRASLGGEYRSLHLADEESKA